MRHAIGYVLALPLVALGWTVGAIVKVARLAWAAAREGYEMGAKGRG